MQCHQLGKYDQKQQLDLKTALEMAWNEWVKDIAEDPKTDYDESADDIVLTYDSKLLSPSYLKQGDCTIKLGTCW